MKELRFERDKRLLTAADYSAVFEKNRCFKDRAFLILVKKRLVEGEDFTHEKSQPRLGLAVSKKNFKKAVDRNLIKRIIRESFRLHQASLKGLDIVVMSRGTTSVADRAALHTSLERHWEKIIETCGQY
ncbi:ribonuclease P protein component [Ignatzschineria rhizosphaerae]|uniref:Ribonuclease P protein component n=1 Tax=Ignatzschineria rhizosphaerae TaxID=2923279 RepID=A0ABY3X5N9_9GAMM|nr:ribonuclease P protein component [Ignatzschineria rhizosphaerae]UNM96782.1 ribonuclease P protein component [Ignatzschineria rhizosphaerae]